jgi:hypothetical protein
MSASVMRMCVIAGQREWTTQTGSSGNSRWILSPECQNLRGKPEGQCRWILQCRNSNVQAKEFRFVVMNILQEYGL